VVWGGRLLEGDSLGGGGGGDCGGGGGRGGFRGISCRKGSYSCTSKRLSNLTLLDKGALMKNLPLRDAGGNITGATQRYLIYEHWGGVGRRPKGETDKNGLSYGGGWQGGQMVFYCHKVSRDRKEGEPVLKLSRSVNRMGL